MIKKLQTQLDKLRQRVQNREDRFYSRSDNWQQSPRGEFHAEKTADLQKLADELESVIKGLEETL